MSREGMTAIACNVADHDRIVSLLVGQSINSFLRELLNDWLEENGQPVLAEAVNPHGRPRTQARMTIDA